MSGLPAKRCGIEVSLLPYDLIFKILLLLPAKDLLRLSFVCKTWRRLINSPNFVEAHMSRCETVLTFLKHVSQPHPNTFSIDTKNPQFTLFEQPSSRKRKLQIYLMEFKDGNGKISDPNICGFGEILATCDGLVLARNRTGSLLILNPTTRKLLPLKSGTIAPHREESYGFVFSDRAHEYKAVHVFRDESGHTDSEILSLRTMSWRGGSVPSFGLFRDFNHKAVAASGVLYWLPGTHNANYLVSMDIFDEKFVTKDLPVNSSGMNDRLIENGGMLNFVAQMTVYRIQLWTLKRNDCDEEWVKRYTINMDYDITGLVPVFMTKNGRCLILKLSKQAIYEYDMEDEEMKILVDGNVNFNYKVAFPLVNTLASWENSGPLW
ncbi:putative F-box/LRR-repeat/kelch-repeat protein At1g11620 [Cynara cardunculus var. scolymus]|uniref:putative F-box/LRR-repeat/kelch-repeat protein At1g11620 n=1 Tax=Cynara cardunculus var. scolymus TaxID=59895 RepID=UPI000D625A16|nr:putative F-box/LRR-repeat/kelch-repeat protein At1g11620 [Cynara cardunculus var. scolymus]